MDMARARLGILAVVFGLGFVSSVIAADLDFTLTAPPGWKPRTKSTALAQYQKGPSSFIVTADSMPADAVTPDTYVGFIKKQLGQVFKDITYDPVVSGKKAACETRELKYSGTTSGMKMKYDVLYIFRGGKAYTLTGGTLADLFTAALAADIKAFFDSFTFK